MPYYIWCKRGKTLILMIYHSAGLLFFIINKIDIYCICTVYYRILPTVFMKAISDRLSYIWNALLETDLVRTKVTTKENIADFERILNKVTPMTGQEKLVYEVFRHLSSISRAGLGKFLEDNRTSFLSLACDGGMIVNLLGLRDTIALKWDIKREDYVVMGLENVSGEGSRSWGDMIPRDEARTERSDNRVRTERTREPREYVRSDNRTDSRERANNRERSDNRTREPREYNTDQKSKYAPKSKEKYEKKNPQKNNDKQKVQGGLKPLSTEKQAKILNSIRETKSFADAVKETPVVSTVVAQAQPTDTSTQTQPTVATISADGTKTPVEITQADLDVIMHLVDK